MTLADKIGTLVFTLVVGGVIVGFTASLTGWPVILWLWVCRKLNPMPTLQDLSKKARR